MIPVLSGAECNNWLVYLELFHKKFVLQNTCLLLWYNFLWKSSKWTNWLLDSAPESNHLAVPDQSLSLERVLQTWHGKNFFFAPKWPKISFRLIFSKAKSLGHTVSYRFILLVESNCRIWKSPPSLNIVVCSCISITTKAIPTEILEPFWP